MASSGRVPKEVLALMQQTIQVQESTSATQTNTFGEIDASGSTRQVKCYLTSTSAIQELTTTRDIVPTTVAYCDDINIDGNEKVTLPSGKVTGIETVETYYDIVGALYQVVTLE